MATGLFTIEFYEEGGRAPVEEWMDSELTEVEHAALLSAFEHILSHLGVNVCGTEWGKQLGTGLFEFRVRHTADEIARMFGAHADVAKRRANVLLRVFCHAYGEKIVLLLNAYDKGEDPSEKRQQREIATARKRLTEFQARRARARKDQRRGGRG